MPRNALLVALIAILATGQAREPVAAQEHPDFLPLTQEPIEALPNLDGPDPSPSEVPSEEIADPFPRSPEELALEQEKASTNPLAEPPDVVLDLAPQVGGSRAGTSFLGLDYTTGGTKTPPDVTIARSSQRVLEAVNSALRLFDSNGNVIATRFTAAFFGIAENPGVFDPKVFYDRDSRRYFLVVLEKVLDGSPQRLFLAVSRSPDPASFATGPNAREWCRYGLEARTDIGTNDVTFADYPSLGVGRDVVMISANQFGLRQPNISKGFPLLRLLSKTALGNNSSGLCPALPQVFGARPLPFADNLPANAQTLQPVQHYTFPNSLGGTSGYVVGALPEPSKGYRVWRVVDGASSTPRLEQITANLLGLRLYVKAPTAPQPSGGALFTGDTRILQAAGIGDSIWITQTTGCQIGPSNSNNEACLRVVRIGINSGSAGFRANVLEQSTIGGGAGVFLWVPSIAATDLGKIAIAANRSSTILGTGWVGSVWTTKAPGSQFAPFASLRSGSCGRAANAKSGDFSGAQTDPDGVSIWLGGESFGSVGSSCNWRTAILKVVP